MGKLCREETIWWRKESRRPVMEKRRTGSIVFSSSTAPRVTGKETPRSYRDWSPSANAIRRTGTVNAAKRKLKMLVNGQRNAHTDDASIHAGRYTSAMAHGSLVAAKSVSDLGDTVTTVVISNDKMLFAGIFLFGVRSLFPACFCF